MFMMYGCVCDELKAMKEGLNDVIPPELLSGLTAEVCISLSHTHTHTHTHSLIRSFTHTLTHIHTYTHARALTHFVYVLILTHMHT